MDMAQTPPQGAPEAPAQGGMTICINCAPDGSITVTKEPYEGGEAGSGQPAQGIGDALKQALDLYQSSSAAEGEQAFNQGFGAQPKAQAKPGQAPAGFM